MNFTIFTEPKEIEKTVDFRLLYGPDGQIKLCVVNNQGNTVPNGMLLRVTPNGSLELPRGIDKKIGLPLDENGRWKIVKSY